MIYAVVSCCGVSCWYNWRLLEALFAEIASVLQAASYESLSSVGRESLRWTELAAASVLDFVAALHREQRPSAAAGRFAQLHKITPSCRRRSAAHACERDERRPRNVEREGGS